VQAQSDLLRLDKGKTHKPYDPLHEFSGLGSGTQDRKALSSQIEKAEKLVYKLQSKMNEVDAQLDALPLSLRAGKAVKSDGPAFAVADFEDGKTSHKLGGNWEAEADTNKLGTTYNPRPLTISPGGYKGSKNCLHFFGHFGRPAAGLWPFTDVG